MDPPAPHCQCIVRILSLFTFSDPVRHTDSVCDFEGTNVMNPLQPETTAGNVPEAFPLVDEILSEHRETLGRNFDAFHNHVLRVLHFCHHLQACSPEETQMLEVAAAFHNLSIWTHRTKDCLKPSAALAAEWLMRTGRTSWTYPVVDMIESRHGPGTVQEPHRCLTEVFRRAHWIDVSLGMRRFGLSRDVVESVRQAFPGCGFHFLLLRRIALKALFDQLWNPYPMATQGL